MPSLRYSIAVLVLLLSHGGLAQIWQTALGVTLDHKHSGAEYIVGKADTLKYYLDNNTLADVGVTLILIGEDAVLDTTRIFLFSEQQHHGYIHFTPTQNIDYSHTLIVVPDHWIGPGFSAIITHVKTGLPYYDATNNLFEDSLKAALVQLLNGAATLTYSTARDSMFMIIDNQRVNGQGAAVNTLECVYTGTLATGYVDRLDAQTTFNFNTEHTWPQSLFSGASPMYSDLHHLFPTTESSNSERANKPFGIVANPSWQVGGSKSNSTSFEPRDAQKGATARAMLYFLARYPNYGAFVTPTSELLLRTWASQFPADAIDSARNEDIHRIQGNRNPFVDAPYLLNRITTFTGTWQPAPPDTGWLIYPDSILVGGVGYGYILGMIAIHNTGTVAIRPDFPAMEAALDDSTKLPAVSCGLAMDTVTVSVFPFFNPVFIDSLLPGKTLLVRFCIRADLVQVGTLTYAIPVVFKEAETDTTWVKLVAVEERNHMALSNRKPEPPGAIVVFPNPGSGLFQVQLPSFESGLLEVFDAWGRLVRQQSILGEKVAFVDLTDYAGGLYLFQVRASDGFFWSTKLLKQ